MLFEIKRNDNKIYILGKATSKSESSLEFDDSLEAVVNENREKNKIVYYDTKLDKIKVKDSKYRDIPLTDFNRVKALKKARLDLESIVKDVDMIDYIRYIDCNNELNSKGYFVTDENREEVYLDILEKGDEKVIDILEEFLITKDKLTIIKSAKKRYDELEEEIKASSEENLDTKKLSELLNIEF